ncbi:MAG: undecaprenyl-diphosphate phosphatase [Bdellovibrionaceae bacterium]|nr:undecaprenyl-diphosphate phosphatase [Pseudobdellovibrionaceae bacterium]
MSYIHILILSFVEGLTEFLPVSSTGHLILTNYFLGLEASEFSKAFDVIIQFGAIAAVLVIYKERFRFNLDFYKKLFIGFLPAAIIGFLSKKYVSDMMESTVVVAWALIMGGIAMIITDWIFSRKADENNQVDYKKSLIIGTSQCLALIPGVSRSAATIVSGQMVGLNKKDAAEFSFFLAVPTLTAATLYKLWKIKDIVHVEHLTQLAVGTILSFIFAIFAIRFFLAIVKNYGFKWFGIYRIILGALVLFAMKS